MTSYATVSGYKPLQQNQGTIPSQNAQKILRCAECGAIFMNYQDLYLHNRLHMSLITESNILPQHMRIAEPQNSHFTPVIANSVTIGIDNASESNISYLRSEDHVGSNRAACALHCSLCNHTFTNRTQLINHNIAHGANNIDSVCNEENVQFREKVKLNDEFVNRFIHSALVKPVSHPHYTFRSIEHESNEIRNTDSENIVSNERQLNNLSFQSNMILHSEISSKVLEGCFAESRLLKYNGKYHFRKLYDFDNKRYKCEQCSQIFSQKSKLKTHCLIHSNRRIFKCFSCEKAYMSKSKLSAHIRLHTKSNIHQCKICNKIFTYPSYLEEHMNSHKSNNQIGVERKQKNLRFECNICKKKFRFVKILNTHLKLHSGKCLLQCNICDKKFNQKYSLKIHLKSHGDKIHKCKYCDKSFTQKSNLVEHIRIHTKVKPFECNFCNKRFCQSSHLKSHIASHDSTRQHQCQLCSKKFKLTSHLKRHLNSHTGLKTYRCDKCNQLFSHAFSLKRHLKRHDEFPV